jgi:peptidoglycan/xylan/chitin deacetylase (PgdA/CDA1 family)
MPASQNFMMKLRRNLNGLRRETSWQLGLSRSCFQHAQGSRILVYHGICENHHLKYNTLFIKRKTFETQLRFYKKYFNIVSLGNYYDRQFDDKKFTICLTFDDGFANNYKYVLPLLEQYQVPATFFIPGIRHAGYDILWNDVLAIARKFGPARISFEKRFFYKDRHGKYRSSDTGMLLADLLRSATFESKKQMMHMLEHLKQKAHEDYWLQMTEDQIKTLADSKWATIGSHGYYHNDLSRVPAAEARNELLKSKQFLETITGKEISAFAFPYGAYTREVVQEARNAGYKQVLTTGSLFAGDEKDRTLKERFTVNPFISVINQMHANISGKYE